MNRNSIDENKAIQDGLESFLDREIGAEMVRSTSQQTVSDREVAPVPKELKTEFATKSVSVPKKKEHPAKEKVWTEEICEEDIYEEDIYEEEIFEEDIPDHRSFVRKKEDKKKKKKRKKEKRSKKWLRTLIVFFVLLAVSAIGWYMVIGNIYTKMNYEKTSGLASEPMKQDGVTNILLIGNDSRDNGEDGRSDAMILISISNETKTIHMTSLLRDMYVEIPGHDGNRLNAAYAYGGPSLLCETIEQNFGIEVNRYVLVNFQAFAALVDAVGGIDLEVTNEEVQWINAYLNEYNLLEGREMTTDYLDTSLSGEIHLNGPQALAYSRNRYIGTDFGRTERQRKVLNAVIKKLPIAFATNHDELIGELFPNLTTNLTQTEMFRLSFDAGKLLSYEVLQTTIPAEGTYTNASIRGMSVLEVDFEANKELIRKEIYGKEE